jgi:hypothetical protein
MACFVLVNSELTVHFATNGHSTRSSTFHDATVRMNLDRRTPGRCVQLRHMDTPKLFAKYVRPLAPLKGKDEPRLHLEHECHRNNWDGVMFSQQRKVDGTI